MMSKTQILYLAVKIYFLYSKVCECLENSVMCGGTLSSHSGMIQSPGWPNEYPNNEHCSWTFYCDESENVAIQFETFDLEKDSSCK